MAAWVPPVADERESLLAFLAQQRNAIRAACFGLSDQQLRATPSASALSVGGLVKHVTDVERGWMRRIEGTPEAPVDLGDDAVAAYANAFRLGPDQGFAEVLAGYDEAAADTEKVVRAISDLGQPVPVPKGVPWFPADVDAWTVRWVLLHLIEEVARHAGHADIVRESIDRATSWELLAAVEDWPPMPWVRPWQPPAVPVS